MRTGGSLVFLDTSIWVLKTLNLRPSPCSFFLFVEITDSDSFFFRKQDVASKLPRGNFLEPYLSQLSDALWGLFQNSIQEISLTTTSIFCSCFLLQKHVYSFSYTYINDFQTVFIWLTRCCFHTSTIQASFSTSDLSIDGFLTINGGSPIAGWFMRQNPIKMDGF